MTFKKILYKGVDDIYLMGGKTKKLRTKI